MSENLNPRSATDFWIVGTFRSYVLSRRMFPLRRHDQEGAQGPRPHVIDVADDLVRRKLRRLVSSVPMLRANMDRGV